MIILTHHHIDHTGSVKALKEAGAGKVAIHEADASFVSGQQKAPLPEGWRGALFRVMGLFMKPRPFLPDIILHDGDVIDGLTCIHTPGHTPGSIRLLDPAAGILFAGDILRFDGEKIGEAPAQYTQDPAFAHRFIRKIAALDFDIMLSGHGVPLRPDAAARVREYAAQI